MNHPDTVWLFDVDGTLIGSILGAQLRPGAERLIKTLHEKGVTLVLWSAGGEKYAQRMLAQFNLDVYFSAFYSKDKRGSDGLYVVDHLDIEHQPGTVVDDYAHEILVAERVISVRQFLGPNTHDRGLDEALRFAGEINLRSETD